MLRGGAVRCWGDNYFGQLGYGHTNDIGYADELPKSVGDVPLGGKAVALAAGGNHNCALLDTERFAVGVETSLASLATATPRTLAIMNFPTQSEMFS